MDKGPLEGIRVLEVAGYLAAPQAGALLRSLGAEVVKVEPPGGEAYRRGMGTRDAYFRQSNAGKRSIVVDLKAGEGVALVKALLPRFDVLMQNFRPGVLDRLGLSAEVCREINPSLIYASLSGFGEGGPLRDRPAYDTIAQSLSGHVAMMNDPGDIRQLGGAAADLVTAMTLTMGVLAALVGRGASPDRKGMLMQTSLLEALSCLTMDSISVYFDQGVSATRRTRHPPAQGFCVPTADGRALTVHTTSNVKFFLTLIELVGRPELKDDPRFATYPDRRENFYELEAILREEFAKHPLAEWERRLAEVDLPNAPVLSIEEAIRHPQTEWLELLEPERDGLALLRPPLRFDGARPHRDFEAPEAGADTRAVAAEVLSAEAVDALIARGVISEATG